MLFGHTRLDDPTAGMSVPVAVDSAVTGIQRSDPGFQPKSIVVENPSSRWILLTDLKRWIQPRVIGKVIRWPPDGPMVKQVSFRVDQAPTGYIVDATQLAPITLIFQDFEQIETAGVALPIAPLGAAPGQEVGLIPNTGHFPAGIPAGYTLPLQTAPINPVGGNSDAIALLAASTTAILGANNGLWILRKIHISSSVAVINKVRLLDGATGFHTVILPANAQPYIYEWPGEGYRTQLGNSSLNIYTDNAGTFGIDADITFAV